MMLKKWTKEEDKLIIDAYLKGGQKGLEFLNIGRTQKAMLSRIGKLGVRRCTDSKWSVEEESLLRLYYSEEGAKGCIDKGLTKSYEEVLNKANYEGLRYLNEEWSDVEIALIRDLYPQGGVQYCIDGGIKRSRCSIKNKAQRLGLRIRSKYTIVSSNSWSVEEEGLLRLHYPLLGVKGCIANGLNRSEEAIRYKARVLGVRVDRGSCDISNLKSKWSQGEVDTLRLYYPKEGSKGCILRGISKDKKQIQRKARVLGLKYRK